MEHYALILSVLLLVINYSSCSDVQTPDASLKEHVKKLDEMLAEIQSHSQAQEQKYSAVLASLLSQLTQTTDELGDVKASHNETIQTLGKREAELSALWASQNETVLKLESTVIKLEEKDAEISKLWASHNETVLKLESTVIKVEEKDAELTKLRESHNETAINLELTSLKLKVEDEELSKLLASYNATVLDLKELRVKHNSVVVELEGTKSKFENFENRPNLNGLIGFQGSISNGKNATADEPIVFDTIMYSTGVYNKSTGKVTIPMDGTYQIWMDFAYRSPRAAFVFAIHKDHHYIDQAFGRLSDHQHETTSTMTMVYLQKGQSIWIAPTSDVYLDKHFCKFGIVLLNAN